MKNIVRRTIILGSVALLMLGVSTISQAQVNIPLDRKVGEIFVAIGGGQYQVWDFSATCTAPGPPCVVETITDGDGSGSTAGCAFDPTYHPFTTNVTNNDAFKDKIDDPQTALNSVDVLSAAGGRQPTSIAFDSAGNFYVGTGPLGNGLIEEYDPSGHLLQTLPTSASKLSGGSPWIDLAQNAQTIYFTNGSSTIYQYTFSTNKLSKFDTISNSPTLYGLRVLTPAAQASTASIPNGPGLLLVAAVFSTSTTQTSNIQLLNNKGNTIQTYSVTTPVNETNFQVITLDPNGTSFWAGNPTTNNFYRFNLASGSVEAGANTGVANSPAGLCAYGGFSAAELPSINLSKTTSVPQPISVTATLTPGASTTNASCTGTPTDSTGTMDCTFTTAVPNVTQTSQCKPPNDKTTTVSCFTLTLNGINLGSLPTIAGERTLQLAYNYSQIPKPTGTSDTGLLCDLTSPDGTKCEVHSVNVTPNNLADGDTSIYQGFDVATFSTQSALNPVMLKNESHDLTDFLIHGSLRSGGSDTTQSIFTMNEQPIATTGQASCGWISPLINSQYNQGRTIPFKFQGAISFSACPSPSSSQVLTNLAPFMVILQANSVAPGATTGTAPQPVPYTLSNGTQCPAMPDPTNFPNCQMRLDPTSGTYILNVDSSSLTGGGIWYFGWAYDTNTPPQMPSFSYTRNSMTQTAFFQVF